MKYGSLPDVDGRVSRLVMGSMVFSTEKQDLTNDLLDRFFEAGGTAIDIKRKAIEPVSVTSNGKTHHIPADAKIEFHVYHVNADEQSVGGEPERLNPHRMLGKGTYRSAIGFGSGPHRCAGEHLAMAETDVFIRKLLALDGLRMVRHPDISYNETVEGYEISNFMIEVD